MNVYIFILVGISLVVFLTYFGIKSIIEKLQGYIIRLDEAEIKIDETLQKKKSILEDIEKIINTKVNLNQKNFTNFEEISNIEFDRLLSKIEITFNNIFQDYPKDLDDEKCRNLFIDLKINEEMNTAAKVYYNNYTQKLNSSIRKVPIIFIAKFKNIKKHEFFDVQKDLEFVETF